MSYKYLDTITGDAEFIVNGESLEELLVDAGRALVTLMYDVKKLDDKKIMKINVTGTSPSDLVFNWLTEILFLQDTENFFFKEFSVKVKEQNGELVAEGEGRGQEGDPSLVEAYVKAITLHNFYVKKTNNGWEARVVVDL